MHDMLIDPNRTGLGCHRFEHFFFDCQNMHSTAIWLGDLLHHLVGDLNGIKTARVSYRLQKSLSSANSTRESAATVSLRLLRIFFGHRQLKTASPVEADELNGGLFGTATPRFADLVLLLEIGMGLALLGGAVLAHRKRFRPHAWCQSAVVLLNFVIILLVMVPSFRVHVSPKIPAKLGKAYYSLATAHAVLGTVAEIAALYILLSAGTNILPPQFRLTRYKHWMRSVLALWWLVVLLGVATYIRWYVPDLLPR